jgi:FAD/FMN-containing dehydrogenase
VGRWPGCPPRRPRSPTAARRSWPPSSASTTGPADKPGRQAWLEEFAAALRQGDDGAYTGFLGEDGPARVHQAYPGSTWDRLVEVKARYDPTNLFRHNHNVPAAG